ncbi:MAG: hypothetical protein U9N59_08550 [Campylobacterota bacterium]|nr:hypothetical protein [Campylobacterota bacterium]
MYNEEGGFFICKYNQPQSNLTQNSFIGTYNQVMNFRDGMSGSLSYGAVMEVAKIKYEDDELLDFMDFISDCESELSKKRGEAKS